MEQHELDLDRPSSIPSHLHALGSSYLDTEKFLWRIWPGQSPMPTTFVSYLFLCACSFLIVKPVNRPERRGLCLLLPAPSAT